MGQMTIKNAMPTYDSTPKGLAKGLRREVYRNLHFRDETVYSVRKDGLVEGHAMLIILDGNTMYPVTFAVGPKGNQRVRDEQRKNVHAVIRGAIVNAVWHDESNMEHAIDACSYHKDIHMQHRDGYEWKQVTYNPYKYKTFVTVEDEQPILTARKVIIGQTVWAQVPDENTLDLS
jgi:hypothetical protein|tara:strand:+ start:23 stop:547 length:525 start_codon:yes stop_codon:yes gene_type:complete